MAKGVRVSKPCWNRAWCVVAWTIAACSSNEQVLLGHEQSPQSRDAGGDERDAAPIMPGAPGFGTGVVALDPPTIPPPTALVEVAERGRCDDVKVSGKLSIDWMVHDSGDDCTDTACGGVITQIAPQSDQSVWALWQYSDHSRLQHVDANGMEIGSVMLRESLTSLAVDDHGVAWIITIPWFLDNGVGGELRRFDASLGELRALSTRYASGISAVPGHGVVVVTAGTNPAVTLLDYEGRSLWSHEIELGPDGRAAFVTVGRSRITVLHQVAREPAYTGVAAQDFDFNGALVGQRESSVNLSIGAFPGYLRSGVDFDSDLVIGVEPPDPRGGTHIELVGVIDVESMDAAGSSRWALRLSSSLEPALALAPNGDVWVAQLQPQILSNPEPDEFPTSNIARISHDGGTCRLFSYDGIWLQTLETALDGTLWFTADNGFGRFSPNMP